MTKIIVFSRVMG